MGRSALPEYRRKERDIAEVDSTAESRVPDPRAVSSPPRWTAIPLPAITILVLVFHASLLGSWIIDDAGISYAYARNLAAGHGLVSQPGVEAVEGYSNPLWVFLLSLFFLLKIFHPVWIPKALGLALVAVLFFRMAGDFRRWFAPGALAWLPPLLLSLCPPFVIWCFSGLENALYTLVTYLALRATVAAVLDPGKVTAGAWRAGLWTAAAAMTRPDGLVYLPAFPLAMLLLGTGGKAHRAQWRRKVRAVALFGAAFAALFGPFLWSRWWVFHAWLPNTYVAKDGTTFDDLVGLVTLRPPVRFKLGELAAGIGGPLEGWGLLLVALGCAWGLWRCRRDPALRPLLVIFLFLGAATAAYLLLPRDWMQELRFATPVCVFLFLLLGGVAEATRLNRRRWVVILGLVVLVLWGAAGLLRTFRFGAAPTVPFDNVRQTYGEAFNRWARWLDLEDGSILLPDVGGALYASDLRVYDLAMLTDRTIARTLLRDNEAFRDLVFDDLRPSFIHMHDYWSYQGQLYRDPRFSRDYLPLCLRMDGRVRDGAVEAVPSGHFVRRDLVAEKPEILERMRAEAPSTHGCE